MREHRFFQAQPLPTGQTITLDDPASHRIRHVLRLKVGTSITLFNGNGHDYAAELTACHTASTQACIGPIIREEVPSTLHIHLALGITRGERMDFSLQKAVELGVLEITPLFTQRTLVRLSGQKLQRRRAHWQGVIHHACEQSGRNCIPIQQPAQHFLHWIKQPQRAGTQALLLSPEAPQGLAQIPRPHGPILVLVGPEGGLTPEEHQQAAACGFTPIRLGPRILRTETAPLAALAAIQTVWGDFLF